MCRVVRREFGDTLLSVAQARSFVGSALSRWDLPELVDDAVLLTSELVTNAVRHARTSVAVTVAVAEGLAEVGVTDRSPRLVVAGSSPWDQEGGRGLRLTELVAKEWGVTPLPDAKQVWFRLEVRGDWPPSGGCPCGDGVRDGVQLESGRYAVATPGPRDDED